MEMFNLEYISNKRVLDMYNCKVLELDDFLEKLDRFKNKEFICLKHTLIEKDNLQYIEITVEKNCTIKDIYFKDNNIVIRLDNDEMILNPSYCLIKEITFQIDLLEGSIKSYQFKLV